MNILGFDIEVDPNLEGAKVGIVFPTTRILFVSPAMMKLLESGETEWLRTLKCIDAEVYVRNNLGASLPLPAAPNQ